MHGYLGLIVCLLLAFAPGVQAEDAAGAPDVDVEALKNQFKGTSDQQAQMLKALSAGKTGKKGRTSTVSAEEIAKEQLAVQPQQSNMGPSAIETSMRARLKSVSKVSVKEDESYALKKSGLDEPEQTRKHDAVKRNNGDSADKKDNGDSAAQNYISKSSEEDFKLRSSWERFLQNRKVRGVDSDLSQFGYQLFIGAPNTFSPAADIPVPPEYVLGPGDELQMQLYGSRDDTLNLVVDRNGVVELPKVGSLALAGLSFVQAKALVAAQLHRKAIGVTSSVTMGRLRSIRIFVLGDATHPGSYLVSGFSTISHALFAAGGVSKSGSLRHIQLKRNGKTVRELDLYDFLLRGDSRADERLMPGDVVFIPPIGPVVGVAGLATRPAIYELRDEKNVQDVLQIAGGAQADADVAHMQIDRLNKAGDRNILDFNIQGHDVVQNGDILMLFSIPGMRADTVSLLGHVKRPGQYGLIKDMKLTTLISSVGDLLPGAFLGYALIQRTEPVTRTITTLRIPLDKLLVQQDKNSDVLLNADDQVYVFSKSSIDPLNVVSISGQIVNSGQYPYADSMRLLDLIFAAGGPNEESYLKVAELTRYEVVDGKRRQSSHFEVNLSDALAGVADANILLKPHDELLVRTISNWRNVSRIELQGEVKYPGKYPVEEGARLSSVLLRAGGYTDDAYLRAAFFTRESVRQDQQNQIDELAKQTEAEVAKLETTTDSLKDETIRTRQKKQLEVAKRVGEQLQLARATGRVVIELADIEKLKGTAFDLAIRDGDKLYIPKRPDEVMVLGEVYNQTAFVYRDRAGRDDYLKMAGGTTRAGDAGHVYVVRANGMVDAGTKGWFSDSTAHIEPGDAIVVPQALDQFNLLDSVLDWSRATMQIGVSLAAMKTIGVFK